MDSLVKANLIIQTDQSFKPHGWDKRQYKSDMSTTRVKRFRERPRNVSETEAETAPETETETETETERETDGAIATREQEVEGDTDSPSPSSLKKTFGKKKQTQDERVGINSGGRKIPWPNDFRLPDELKSYAESKGIIDPDSVWEHFKNHHKAKGTTFQDWPAAWRTWVCNEDKFVNTSIHHGRSKKLSKDQQTIQATQQVLEEIRDGKI